MRWTWRTLGGGPKRPRSSRRCWRSGRRQKVRFTFAQAEEHVGKLATAYDAYAQALADAEAAGETDVADTAGRAMRALAGRVPVVRVKVTGAGASAASATIDEHAAKVGDPVRGRSGRARRRRDGAGGEGGAEQNHDRRRTARRGARGARRGELPDGARRESRARRARVRARASGAERAVPVAHRRARGRRRRHRRRGRRHVLRDRRHLEEQHVEPGRGAVATGRGDAGERLATRGDRRSRPRPRRRSHSSSAACWRREASRSGCSGRRATLLAGAGDYPQAIAEQTAASLPRRKVWR